MRNVLLSTLAVFALAITPALAKDVVKSSSYAGGDTAASISTTNNGSGYGVVGAGALGFGGAATIKGNDGTLKGSLGVSIGGGVSAVGASSGKTGHASVGTTGQAAGGGSGSTHTTQK